MPPEVVVIYQHLPHYRFGVFAALAQSRRKYVFVAGESEGDGSIPTIPFESLSAKRIVNRWIGGGRLLWQKGVLRLVLRRPAAVIFLGDVSYISTWVGAALCRVLGVPVFFWTIGWHRPETGLKRLVRVSFYRLANTLLLYGDWGRRFGEQSGYPPSRMRVIYNSSSEAPDGPSAETGREVVQDALARVDSAASVVVCSVRLTAGKQLDQLVRAAAAVRASGTNVELVIVGDGPERNSLAALAVNCGLKTHFLGAVYDPMLLQDVYDRSSVCVIPARAGLTVIQSLRFGVPVITHDNPTDQMPEFEAIQPGVNGSLFKSGDIDDLAKQIEFWCAADRETSRRLCRSSLEPRWTPHGQASAIERALTECGVPGK